MKKLLFAGVAVVFAGLVVSPVSAAGKEDRGKLPEKHDSNTLHKIGRAIEYPIRKMGENASVAAHQATGHNSVVKDKAHDSTEVVKPTGSTVVIAKDNPQIGWTPPGQRYMHRRHTNFTQEGRRYYWYNGHRYYMDMQTGARVKID
jgi:hypothetical protein